MELLIHNMICKRLKGGKRRGKPASSVNAHRWWVVEVPLPGTGVSGEYTLGLSLLLKLRGAMEQG